MADMGRKETISGLVGSMIAFAAYVWQSETAAFLDSIVPNAGYYMVRIIFSIAFIYVIGVVIHWAYAKRKKQQRKDVISTEIEDKQQKIEALERKARGEAALEFLLTSTTDWFEIGIENGTLIGIEKSEISSGSIDPPTPYGNYFRISQDKSQPLEMRINATFELPKRGAICLVRKGDLGEIKVKVILSGFLHPTVGEYAYTRSPKEKNELTFPLTIHLI